MNYFKLKEKISIFEQIKQAKILDYRVSINNPSFFLFISLAFSSLFIFIFHYILNDTNYNIKSGIISKRSLIY